MKTVQSKRERSVRLLDKYRSLIQRRLEDPRHSTLRLWDDVTLSFVDVPIAKKVARVRECVDAHLLLKRELRGAPYYITSQRVVEEDGWWVKRIEFRTVRL